MYWYRGKGTKAFQLAEKLNRMLPTAQAVVAGRGVRSTDSLWDVVPVNVLDALAQELPRMRDYE